jgi:hypothetical protein
MSDRSAKRRTKGPFGRLRVVTKDGRRLRVTQPRKTANPVTGRQIVLLSDGDRVVWLTPVEREAADASR